MTLTPAGQACWPTEPPRCAGRLGGQALRGDQGRPPAATVGRCPAAAAVSPARDDVRIECAAHRAPAWVAPPPPPHPARRPVNQILLPPSLWDEPFVAAPPRKTGLWARLPIWPPPKREGPTRSASEAVHRPAPTPYLTAIRQRRRHRPGTPNPPPRYYARPPASPTGPVTGVRPPARSGGRLGRPANDNRPPSSQDFRSALLCLKNKPPQHLENQPERIP